ncbi:MAG: anti-sigma factor, partial [Bacteroidetes bacterium]
MGALPEPEAAEVTALARQYPEIQAEIEAIEAALIAFSEEGVAEPDEKILGAALADISRMDAEKPTTRFAPPVAPAKVVPFWRQPWAVAASVLLFASLGANILLFNRWKGADKQLQQLFAEKESLAAERDNLRTGYEQNLAELTLAQQPGTRIVRMEGLPIAPESSALVYWNAGQKSLKLRVEKLPQPPDGFQYQLWAIQDGKPVDMGVFDFHATLQ